MRAWSLSDVALMLVFSVGLPLAAGGWWRYLSGYDHAREPTPVVEQGAQEKETHKPRLVWTTGAAKQSAPLAGDRQPGEPGERR
jgi:hypothetical protein